MQRIELVNQDMEIVQKAVVEEHNQEQFTTVISSSQIKLVQMDQKVEVVILTTVHQVVEDHVRTTHVQEIVTLEFVTMVASMTMDHGMDREHVMDTANTRKEML
jgi:hypothetical protein